METRTAAVPTPASLPIRPLFDRAAWTEAVIASDLQRDQRHIALVLAHFADPFGELAPGGHQEAAKLSRAARMAPKRVRISLHDLELRGFIRRPSIHTWERQNLVRPVTLTVPAERPPLPLAAGDADA